MRLSSTFLLESAVPIVAFHDQRILRDALANVAVERLSDLPRPLFAEAYSRCVLIDTPELLVIAARWRAGARRELHGHSESAGLYRVVSGAVEEERYLPVNGELSFSVSVLKAQDESYLPRGSFHQLRAVDDSLTLHAYTPRPSEAVSELSEFDWAQIDRARGEHDDRGGSSH